MPPVRKRPAAAATAGRIRRPRPAGAAETDGADDAAPATPMLGLANGVQMPMVGFGTAFFVGAIRRPELTYRSFSAALDAGYRLVDSAVMYGNERQVGGVLGEYFQGGRLSRGDVFVTTKVAHPPTLDYLNAKTQYIYQDDKSAYDGVMQEFFGSLESLGLGFVDLLLVHWPGLFVEPERFPSDWSVQIPSREVAERKRAEMWAALERIYELKLARSIGVSNFTQRHLETLLPNCKVRPMVNQVEVHPYLGQASLVKFCQNADIQVTAYSPLAAGKERVIGDPTVVRLAAERGVAPAQLVLSWLMQRGIAVVPKSTSAERLAENLRAPTGLLSQAEMELMAGLDRGLHTCPDPELIS